MSETASGQGNAGHSVHRGGAEEAYWTPLLSAVAAYSLKVARLEQLLRSKDQTIRYLVADARRLEAKSDVPTYPRKAALASVLLVAAGLATLCLVLLWNLLGRTGVSAGSGFVLTWVLGCIALELLAGGATIWATHRKRLSEARNAVARQASTTTLEGLGKYDEPL